MQEAIEKARETMRDNIGGPFGAMIRDSKGHIICVSSNTVLGDHDPTAHAEVNAIREACRKLGTHDLSEYILYATGYPCPMCLAAAMWANIRTIYYGTTLEEAKRIGFKDDFIYNYMKDKNDTLTIQQLDHDACLTLFQEYEKDKKQIY